MALNTFGIAEINYWTVTHRDTWLQCAGFFNGKGDKATKLTVSLFVICSNPHFVKFHPWVLSLNGRTMLTVNVAI